MDYKVVFVVFGFLHAIIALEEQEYDDGFEVIDTDNIVVTDHQLVIRSTDGHIK